MKKRVVGVILAAFIGLSAAAVTMPKSYAVVTMEEMAIEVRMYDPSDKSIFYVENEQVAADCAKKYGWVMLDKHGVTGDGNDLTPITRIPLETAVKQAQLVFMSAGFDANTAAALVQNNMEYFEKSPTNYEQICITALHFQCNWSKIDEAKLAQLRAQYPNGYTTSAQTTTVATATSAAEEVNQLYASLVHSGMTSEQAMAEVNKQLATIIAKYNK